MRSIAKLVVLVAAAGLLILPGCDKKADDSSKSAAKPQSKAAKSASTKPAGEPAGKAQSPKKAEKPDVGITKFTLTGPNPWGPIEWGAMSSSQTMMTRQPNGVEALASGTAKVGGHDYTWQFTLRLTYPDNKGWRTGEFDLPVGGRTGAHVAFLPESKGAPHLGFGASSGKVKITEVGPKGVFVNGKKNTAKVKGTFEVVGTNNKGEAGYTLKGEFAFLHVM